MIFDHYESLKSNPAFSGYTQETKIRRLETFITMVIQEGVAQLKIGDLADSEIKMLDDVDGVAGYLERERVFYGDIDCYRTACGVLVQGPENKD